MKVYILVMDYGERGIVIHDPYVDESIPRNKCNYINNNKPPGNNWGTAYYIERELQE